MHGFDDHVPVNCILPIDGSEENGRQDGFVDDTAAIEI